MNRPTASAVPLSLFAGVLLAVVLVLQPMAVHADSLTPEAQAALAKTLNYRQGKITLKDGIAEINVPPQFRYLIPPIPRRCSLTSGATFPMRPTMCSA